MLRFRSFACHLGVMIHTLMAVLRDAMCFLVLCWRLAQGSSNCAAQGSRQS